MAEARGAQFRRTAGPLSLWASIEAAGPDAGPEPLGLAFDDSEDYARAQYARRRTFIAFYAYAIPTCEAISAIAEFAGGHSVIEVCAGGGLWASLLAAEGVQVAATDAVPPRAAPHFSIEALDAQDAVRAHPECGCLLMCWPPDKQDAAFRAVDAFQGGRLVYVGDARFSADDNLRTLLARDWQLDAELPLPSWPGLDDYVRLYTRKR